MTSTGEMLPEVVVPIPPESARKRIPKQEWQECVEIWTLITRAYLSLSPEQLWEVLKSSKGNSLLTFVVSYLNIIGTAHPDENYSTLSQATELRRNIYLLIHRDVFENKSPSMKMTDWKILGDLSRVYKHSTGLTELIDKIWSFHEDFLAKSLQDGYKQVLAKLLESGNLSELAEDRVLTQQLLPLLRASPSAGALFITGSDFFDALITAYTNAPASARSVLILTLYFCLVAPLQTNKPNLSLVYDHLYSMKSAAESQRNPILADIVSDTPFLNRLRKHLSSKPDPRSGALIQSLTSFQRPSNLRYKRPSRQKHKKGKGKAHHQPTQEMHIHHLDKIIQIQDLFPALGSAFTAKLLDEYGDDVETVTAHLLEDDIPEHLHSEDRSANLVSSTHFTKPADIEPTQLAKNLAPAPTPPPEQQHPESEPQLPQRHNIHDNDNFDRLTVSASQLHVGHRDHNLTQSASERLASKAAILSALSAFDADDDERDDTYDIEDVGGTVDTAASQEDNERHKKPRDRSAQDEHAGFDEAVEARLLEVYKSSPEIFARDATTRRSKERKSLRDETGLDDERLEGWALMITREPARLRKLENKFASNVSAGYRQRELGRSAWRGGAKDSEGEGDTDGLSSGGEAVVGGSRTRGSGAPSRSRGRGGRGNPGATNVAGPSSDKGTQVSRQRKEANKSSRANHSRRDQRARKMARGGFPS